LVRRITTSVCRRTLGAWGNQIGDIVNKSWIGIDRAKEREQRETTMSDTKANAHQEPGALFSFFADRKIKTKISIGFALALLITAVISSIAYYSLLRIATSLHEYSRLGSVVGSARDIDRNFLAFRRQVDIYSNSGNQQAAEAAEKARRTVKDLLVKGLAVTLQVERRAKLTRVSEQFEVYAKDFDKVIVLRAVQDKLREEVLLPAGQNCRKASSSCRRGPLPRQATRTR